MRNPHVRSQAAWLTNLLNGLASRPSDFAGPRESAFGPSPPARMRPAPDRTDELVQRILDDAAGRRSPIGLFDPIVSYPQGSHLFAATFGSPERVSEGSPMHANHRNPTDELGDRMSTVEWMRRRNDQLRQPELLAAAAPANRGQNGPPAADTVDPLEYWSEYRAPAGRSTSGGDQKALDLPAARAAGVENPGAVEIENPGAIFNDVDEAARHIHPLMNRVSRSQNMEYQWAYYRDKATGKVGYADPIAAGLREEQERTSIHSAMAEGLIQTLWT